MCIRDRDQTALSVHHGQHTADTGGCALCTILHYHMSGSHAYCRTVVHMTGHDRQISVDRTAGNALNLSVKDISVHSHNLQMEGCHKASPSLLLCLFRFLKDIVNSSRKQEAALGNLIALAVQNLLKATNGFL